MLGRFSINIKVTAVLLGVLVLAVIFQLVYVTPRLIHEAIEHENAHQREIASQIATGLDMVFARAKTELENIAALPGIVSLEKEQMDQVLRDRNRTDQFFNYYFVMDRQGRWLSYPSRDELVGKAIPRENMSWVEATFAKNRTVFLDVVASRIQTTVSGFSTPIPAAGRESGALLRGVIVVSERNIALKLIKHTHVHPNGFAYVVGANGHLIAHPRRTVKPDLQESSDYSNYAPVKKVMQGETGVLEYEYEGQKWVAAYSPIKTTGWGVVTQQPRADVVALAQDRASAIWPLLMAATLLGILLIGIVIHLALRPLGRLVKDLEAGSVSTDQTTWPQDEFGRLAQQFQELYAKLDRSREILRVSEERFRSLVETTSDWIWQVDKDGVYTYVSPKIKEVLGYEPEEVLGKTPFSMMPPDEAERVQGFFTKAAVSRQPLDHLENVNLHKDGRRVFLETSGVPVFDEAGAFQGYRGIDRDITDRKRGEEQRLSLQRQVQQAQKLESLGVLAGGIAHDFNNLLVGILGNAELALDELSPMSPARSSITEIERAAKRAAELAKQMLAYSGRGRFVIEPIDLNVFVEEMTHLLEISISKKCELKCDFAKDLPSFDGDVTQIRQIIMNLITNSSESLGDKSGVIALSTGAMDCDRAYLDDVSEVLQAGMEKPAPEGRYVYFEVSDTGCGMDTETIEKIFDPFFTTKFTGRGLGMSAVLGIVRGHKGVIKVSSEVGRGTTFRTLFPAKETAGKTEEQMTPGREGKGWRGSGTVLLVDDEDTVRDVGRRMLERVGFSVLVAKDGREALSAFNGQANEIVCVLLDLTMPHVDGEECFRELRRIRSDVQVILCSGFDEGEATRRFAGQGLVGFIQKPYDMDTLREKLKKVVGDGV